MGISIVGWVLIGLAGGLIARMLHRGYVEMGGSGTIVLGILGALGGGGIASLIWPGEGPYHPSGWILAVLGTVVVLAIGAAGTRRIEDRSPST